MSDPDICFYFDPVCPLAWMTSKWVRQVTAQRDYAVDWRFISLRMINASVDCDSHSQPATKPVTPPASSCCGWRRGSERTTAATWSVLSTRRSAPFPAPDGVAFFGPIISHLRERPQLRSFGVDTDQVGIQEDWHGGSRRTKK